MSLEHLPSTPPPENPEAVLSPESVETQMQEMRRKLAIAEGRVVKTKNAIDAVWDDEAARNLASDAWVKAKAEFEQTLADITNHELQLAALVHAPSGKYKVNISFLDQEDEPGHLECEMKEPIKLASLDTVIKRAWEEISRAGIHNFGFVAPTEGYRLGKCSYTVKGPDHFKYRSECRVNENGYVVREIGEAN